MNRVKETREAQNMTQAGLAVAADVSTTTLTMIEVYGYKPTLETQTKIATALNQSVGYLWPEETTAPDQNEGAMD